MHVPNSLNRASCQQGKHGPSAAGLWLQGDPPGEADFFDGGCGLDALPIFKLEFQISSAEKLAGFDRRGLTEGAAVDAHRAGGAVRAVGDKLGIPAINDFEGVGRVEGDHLQKVAGLQSIDVDFLPGG